MRRWIFSTEPATFPWSRVERDGRTRWDGIRGPLARRYVRRVRPGDRILGYHSGPERAIVCLARAATGAYPDPADPAWAALDVVFEAWLARPVPLAALKADRALARMPFLRIPRLSVAPLTAIEERRILGGSHAYSPVP